MYQASKGHKILKFGPVNYYSNVNILCPFIVSFNYYPYKYKNLSPGVILHQKKYLLTFPSRDLVIAFKAVVESHDMTFTDMNPLTLQDQVRLLGLNMSIAWVGGHLPSLVTTRTQKKLPTLFFNYSPNSITATNNYTRIKVSFILTYLNFFKKNHHFISITH